MNRCRFCAQEKNYSDFTAEINDQTSSGRSYRNIVKYFCRVTISSEESLVVCEDCRMVVENFEEFKRKLLYAQRIFRDHRQANRQAFNLSEFKRIYSNEEKALSLKYLFHNFDAEKFSIWHAEYKDRDDMSRIFMRCNLINGMLGYLEKLRNQAFASICVFGEDGDSSISAVWIWPGQDLIFNREPDWQYGFDSYDWIKLEPGTDETKKLITEYFSLNGSDKSGRNLNQRIIFK